MDLTSKLHSYTCQSSRDFGQREGSIVLVVGRKEAEEALQL